MPAEPVDPYDSVIALDIADEQPRVAPGFGRDELPERLDLYSWTARLRGEELRYDKPSKSASGFNHADTFQNELWWYNYGALDGDYGVEVTYACDNAIAGSPFQIGVSQSNGPPPTALRGAIEGTGGKFVTKPVEGVIHVGPDSQHITFGLPDDDKSAGLRLEKITLIKK